MNLYTRISVKPQKLQYENMHITLSSINVSSLSTYFCIPVVGAAVVVDISFTEIVDISFTQTSFLVVVKTAQTESWVELHFLR